MRKPVRFADFLDRLVPVFPNLTIYPPDLTGLLTIRPLEFRHLRTALRSAAMRFVGRNVFLFVALRCQTSQFHRVYCYYRLINTIVVLIYPVRFDGSGLN